MSETRTQLVARKRDLLAALRTLEQDEADGVIDQVAYRAARERYELEAAGVIEQLDALPLDDESQPGQPKRTIRRSWLVVGGAAAVVAVAIVLFLVSALHPRSGNQSVTGDVPTPAVQDPPALRAAEQAVEAHPRSFTSWILLGNQYVNQGDAADADRSYQTAIRLAPTRPEARTLHAMLLGAGGRSAQALVVLHRVERDTPSYSRAWLIDGLLSSHSRRSYPQAIHAWQRFLKLVPKGKIADDVRQLIARTKRAERK